MKDGKPSESPLVTAAAQRALAPYATLLPDEIRDGFKSLVSAFLVVHPVGISMIARLTPGLPVEVRASDDKIQQMRQGYALFDALRRIMNEVRRRMRKRGERRFLIPDTPLLLLHALLGYLPIDDSIWKASDAEARVMLDGTCKAIAGALFTGLVAELDRNPSVLKEWGETGLRVSRLRQRMQAVHQSALSRMPANERTMLTRYESCGWDIEKLRERLNVHRVETSIRCVYAFLELGQALTDEIEETLGE